MNRRWTTFGFAILMSALVFAQDASLAWAPKAGETHTYALHIEFSLFGDTAVYTSKVQEKVTEASGDRYTVETSQTDYKVSVFGEEGTVNDKDMPKAQTVFASNGDVLEVRGDLVNDAVYRMANLTAIRRPDKPVKVGDTWTREAKGDLKTGALSSKVNYKVEAEEKVGERDALAVSFDYTETEGTDPARSVGKVWFEKTGGLVLKVETTWSSAPIPGSQNPITGTMKLELEK